MHTLHFVAVQSLEAPDSFMLMFNTQQTQGEGAVYTLLDNVSSEVSAMLCVGVCSITM